MTYRLRWLRHRFWWHLTQALGEASGVLMKLSYQAFKLELRAFKKAEELR